MLERQGVPSNFINAIHTFYDNNQQFIAASVFATALDVSDGTEDGQLSVQTIKAGTLTTAASITNLGNVFDRLSKHKNNSSFNILNNGQQNIQ